MSKKGVWITGATSGIGKSLALKLADSEHKVIASARKKNELETYVSGAKDNIFAVPVDVTDPNSVNDAYKQISKDYSVDCLINNAGVTVFKSAAETTEEEIHSIIETNLTGAIRVTQTVLPEMMERKSGTIINILSVAADTVFPKSSVYSASKAGLTAYAKVLREEVRKYNIRVVNVYPGATRTPIWPNDVLEEFGERMMSPDDLADAVFNIVSSNSSVVFEEVVLRPIKGDLK